MVEVAHRVVETNGIRMHVAEAGRGPLVVLCHGFPESWYSWRHQLAALAEAAALIDTPWAMAAIPDFVHPATRGERPANLEQLLAFGAALARLAAEDPAVHRLMAEVQHLVKPRSAYQDPELIQRVLTVMAATP